MTNTGNRVGTNGDPTVRQADSGAPVSPGRRRAMRLLALAAVAMAAGELPALAGQAETGIDQYAGTFVAFCDTLIPADELTPAASALGVPAAILADVRGNALAERLLAAGCEWLDAVCAGRFLDADDAARHAACVRMAGEPWESPAGRFFQLMRNTVMADYYAQPQAWRGLALDRPPQPLGFYEAIA